MSDPDQPTFKLKEFQNFPHLFAADERSALEQWGKHAEDLTNGVVQPISNEEAQFVSAAKGSSPPATRFQRIWLRYLQATKAERKFIELGNEIVHLQNNRTRLIADLKKFDGWQKSSFQQGGTEQLPGEELTDKVSRLEVWGKSAWRQLEDVKVQSGRKIHSLEQQIIALQSKTIDSENVSRNVKIPSSTELDTSAIDPWDGRGNDWREQR